MNSNERTSLRSYARSRGYSPSSVHSWCVKGWIPRDESGRIDPAAADAQLAARRPPRVNGPALPSAGGATLLEARTKHETARAALARLELRRRRGDLVSRAEVEAAAFTAARTARDKLLTLPRRLAQALAATADPSEVERILEAEIDEVCLELSRPPAPVRGKGNR